jgi:hypothetical protein
METREARILSARAGQVRPMIRARFPAGDSTSMSRDGAGFRGAGLCRGAVLMGPVYTRGLTMYMRETARPRKSIFIDSQERQDMLRVEQAIEH